MQLMHLQESEYLQMDITLEVTWEKVPMAMSKKWVET
jgi:hypothetical protein